MQSPKPFAFTAPNTLDRHHLVLGIHLSPGGTQFDLSGLCLGLACPHIHLPLAAPRELYLTPDLKGSSYLSTSLKARTSPEPREFLWFPRGLLPSSSCLQFTEPREHENMDSVLLSGHMTVYPPASGAGIYPDSQGRGLSWIFPFLYILCSCLTQKTQCPLDKSKL